MIDAKRTHENAMLARAAAGDASAWDWVQAKFKAMVWQLARRYHTPDQDLEDASQVGFLALFEAVQKFDPARGASFFTFGYSWVRGRLLSDMRNGHLVRLKMDERGARYANVASIDEAISDEDANTMAKFLADPRADVVEEAAREEENAHVRRCLSLLPAKDHRVLLARIDGETLRDIGGEHGVSKERIRQIETCALKRLKIVIEKTPVGSPKLEVKLLD